MNKYVAHKNAWIYESPDGGRTVYRRPFGKLGPKQLVLWRTVPGIINLNWWREFLIVSQKQFQNKSKMDQYLESDTGKLELFDIILDALSTGLKHNFSKTDLVIIKCVDDECTLRCSKEDYISALESPLRWLEKQELYEKCLIVSDLINSYKK